MRYSANLRLDVLGIKRSLLNYFDNSDTHSELLCDWQAKFSSEIHMQITVWSRPVPQGGYITQGHLYDGDVRVAHTDMEIDKIVGEYSANYGGHEYVVNVYDHPDQEPPVTKSATDDLRPEYDSSKLQRQPAIEGTGPYLVVLGNALKSFEFYGPFKTLEQATDFNATMLEFPGLVASFEDYGVNPPEPAFSEEECALVLRADMICTSLGNVAPDAAGKESYHKLSRELSRLRMKMITTNK